MIVVSAEIKLALDQSPVMRTETLDMDVYGDLVAGQSVVRLEGRRYGVARYERRGILALAALVLLLPSK